MYSQSNLFFYFFHPATRDDLYFSPSCSSLCKNPGSRVVNFARVRILEARSKPECTDEVLGVYELSQQLSPCQPEATGYTKTFTGKYSAWIYEICPRRSLISVTTANFNDFLRTSYPKCIKLGLRFYSWPQNYSRTIIELHLHEKTLSAAAAATAPAALRSVYLKNSISMHASIRV